MCEFRIETLLSNEIRYQELVREVNCRLMFISQITLLKQAYSNESLDTTALECYGFTKTELSNIHPGKEALVTTLAITASILLVIQLIVEIINAVFGGGGSGGGGGGTIHRTERKFDRKWEWYTQQPGPKVKVTDLIYEDMYGQYMKTAKDIDSILPPEVGKILGSCVRTLGDIEDMSLVEGTKALKEHSETLGVFKARIDANKKTYNNKYRTIKGLRDNKSDYEKHTKGYKDNLEGIRDYLDKLNATIKRYSKEHDGDVPELATKLQAYTKLTQTTLTKALALVVNCRDKAVGLFEMAKPKK